MDSRKLLIICCFILVFFNVRGNSAENELVIKGITIHGNSVTKERIIFRELNFAVGDSTTLMELPKLIERSENNLFNTSLFNFVDINFLSSDKNVLIHIHVIERWYIWPIPIFEHADRNLPAWIRNPDFRKLNYGLQLDWKNFRGRRELLSLRMRLGYKEQLLLSYEKPYLDKAQKHGIKFTLSKMRQREVLLKSINNKPYYFSDHPKYVYESFEPLLTYQYRRNLYIKHIFQVGFHRISFQNEALHEAFLGRQYGQDLKWFSFAYSAEIDYRDYRMYPLDGWFFRFSLGRRGLNMMKDFQFETNILELTGTIHQKIMPGLYIETAAKTRISNDVNSPYFFKQGIGYENYLRGFEYYLIDGNNYFLSHNNLKYTIIPKKTFTIQWLPRPQFNKVHYSFFCNLFMDVAYVDGSYYETEIINDLSNEFLYSAGIGFDFVTYYDQVYRLEFTLNSLAEPGIFLHMETPFRRW